MVSLNIPGDRLVVAEATVWKRFVAFLVDVLIIDLLLLAPFNVVYAQYDIDISSLLQGGASSLPSGLLFAGFLAGIVFLLYFALLERHLRATIGMRLFGLRIQGGDGFWRCVARNLYALPIFPLQLLWVIEPVHLLLTKKRLLEQLTKTRTVELVVV